MPKLACSTSWSTRKTAKSTIGTPLSKASARWPPARSGSRHVAVEQFDQHILRAADKGDAHTGADRLGLDGEFGALGLQLLAHPVDVAHPQAHVIEPDKAAFRLFGKCGIRGNLRDEKHHAAEPDVGAR